MTQNCPFKQGMHDCNCHYTIFLKTFPENNERKPNGYVSKGGKEYCQTAIVADPNPEKFGPGQNGDILAPDVEEGYHNTCIKALAEADGKKPAQLHTPWDPDFNCTTKTPFQPLDAIITDESVGHVLQTYVVHKGQSQKDVYDMLNEGGHADGFYSRSATTGKYSQSAVNHFGYPDDDDVTDVDSDSDDSEF